jgi:AraC-like DNA-binding protein
MTSFETITPRLLDDIAPFVANRPEPTGVETPVPRLTVWSATESSQPTPAAFKPMLYAVLQGTRVLFIGVNRFEVTAGACTASSFGLPYVDQLLTASPTEPFIGIRLDLDIAKLTRIMLDMPKRENNWVCAAAAGDLGGAVGEAFSRLVSLVNKPGDVAMLAPHYESELYYRLLQSPMGDTLRQIGQRDARARHIKAAADWLADNNQKPVSIPDLAASAGMSVTSFHRHFKAITGYSPLAFQRHMRLLEARKLLAAGSATVSRVAFDVGYASASQFSREYKSMFGAPPVEALPR